ncbi:glycosyltransferase [Geobacter chapellei]|uniref:Glycosyltransferase n=2 Tax=Pelotalea chapellei TaxID=44671 RepID=A0ABS5U822_9BACT|nr:glycosyltransferase [Pelotalea chapellei]MBT1071819.1 glycosyltransferase [Pelotalea chapellei]
MALTLLRRLQTDDRIELSVLLLNNGKLADCLKKNHLNVHVIDEQKHSFHQILYKSRALLKRWSPDIIHSHRYKENILALLARGEKNHIRLVATQHGLPEHYGNKISFRARSIAKIHLHLLAKMFSSVVAVSADVQSFLLGQPGFREDRVEIIHNGIELPEAFAKKDETAVDFVIGSSGRLFQVKDYPLLCEVASSVAKRSREKIRFELAGDGPQRALLEKLITHLDMKESFLLRGHQEDMDSFYEGLDLYMSTSIHEGIPMAVLEALVRGLPVIAPAVGGFKEIINDGVEGFLIPDRDPHSFAEKCLLIQGNENLRRKMSLAARKRIEHAFSAQSMADAYYRLYCRTMIQ